MTIKQGSIRAGLVFQVKSAVGESTIAAAEATLAKRLYDGLLTNRRIVVLGPSSPSSYNFIGAHSASRLPIISFLIKGPADAEGRSRFLHSSFVCAVLNDVFGIQVSGGCACAGPYALRILGIGVAASMALETLLLEQSEIMRPAFVRLSLPYFTSDSELEYALAALNAVADHGWRLLPIYCMVAKTGEWRHRTWARSFPKRRWLAHMRFPPVSQHDDSFISGARHVGTCATKSLSTENTLETRLRIQLEDGIRLLEHCGEQHVCSSQSKLQDSTKYSSCVFKNHEADQIGISATSLPKWSHAHVNHEGLTTTSKNYSSVDLFDNQSAETLRWFMFPSEGANILQNVLSRENPRCTPSMFLSLLVHLNPGQTIGVMNPLQYSDTVLISGAGAVSPLRKTEHFPAFGEIHAVERPDMIYIDMPRSKSRKYPLQGLANLHGTQGGLGFQRALEHIRSNAPVVKLRKKDTGAEHIPDMLSDASNSREITVSDSSKLPSIQNEVTNASKSRIFCSASTSYGNAVVHNCEVRTFASSRFFAVPPNKLLRLVTKAVTDWNMISPGDRLLLGLSGGKDSLAMLHLLSALKRRFPPGFFEFSCCTIDPMSDAFNPRPLISYVESLGIQYHYNEENIIEMAAKHMSGDSICAFCARMKRGALYSCMREHGYNKLVLAQHLDDVVESFFLSAMHNGVIRTMKAAYVVCDTFSNITPFS